MPQQDLKRLQKQLKYNESQMPLVAACASCWTNVRTATKRYADQNPMWQRCFKAPETDWHRVWDCENNENLGDAVTNSEHLKRQLNPSVARFWIRGIVPYAHTAFDTAEIIDTSWGWLDV